MVEPALPPGSDEGGSRFRSVAGGAVLKYVAEAVALLFSFVTGVVTARNLGPAGKGDLAALGYLAVLLGSAASLGLGEAGVVAMFGSRRSLRSVFGTTTAALSASAALGVVGFVLATIIQFGPDEAHELRTAVALFAASVPLVAFIGSISPLVDARHHFVDAAAARVSGTIVTAVLTWLLVTVTGHALRGAAFGALVGWVAVVVVLIRPLGREGALQPPRFERGPLVAALRVGLPIQVSQLLMTATVRVDLLVVHAVVGGAIAGEYSVALTLGSLNTFAALAISAASFGRVAAMPAEQLRSYVGFTVRVAIIVAVAVAVVLGPILPWLTPRAFGHGFRGSVGPSLILLGSGVLWSAQWVLCRAAAAKGRGGVLVASYATSVVVMVVGDLALVPDGGAEGAAIASVASSVAGLAVALASNRRLLGVTAADLVPRRGDLAYLRESLQRAVRPATGT